MAGIIDVFGVFKAGKIVANPTLWKNAGSLINAIDIILLSAAWGYRLFVGELAITDEQLSKFSAASGGFLIALSNIIATITTEKNVSVIGIPLAPTTTNEEK